MLMTLVFKIKKIVLSLLCYFDQKSLKTKTFFLVNGYIRLCRIFDYIQNLRLSFYNNQIPPVKQRSRSPFPYTGPLLEEGYQLKR